MASDFTKTVEIDGKDCQFQLLCLDDALELQSMVINLVKGVVTPQGGGITDYSLLSKIGRKVCKELTIDDFEIKSLDDEFRGKTLFFNKVASQGVIANFPDFFTLLDSLPEDSNLKGMVQKSGLVNGL